MGRCQNYGPLLGTLNIRVPFTILRTQKRTIRLTTTPLGLGLPFRDLEIGGYGFGGNIGALMIRMRFFGAHYAILILRKPQNSIGNYFGTYTRV